MSGPMSFRNCRHDFTICETIEFEEGEDEELPPPLTLKDIIALNKAKDYADEVAAAAEAAAEAEAASGGPKSQVSLWDQLQASGW